MATLALDVLPREVSPGRRAFTRLATRRAAMAGLFFVAFFVAMALFAPWVAPYDPLATSWTAIRKAPSAAHWFGTDELGRDTFVRTIYGGRISLLVGLIGTLVSLLIGVTYGAVSGYMGGKIDEAMMRFVDILYSLPYIFLVILLLVFFSRSLVMLFVALGLVQWLTMARIVRGQVLSLREREFVESAVAMGSSKRRILFTEILPNLWAPILVYATLTLPAYIGTEAALSFLGVGVLTPETTFGSMLANSVTYFNVVPTYLFIPGTALVILVISFNLLGDSLRDALDPKAIH